jgi:pyridoxal phosphate enzyme (YggS family)
MDLFDVIQSVDSPRLSQHLAQIAAERNQSLRVFIEVNIGAESSKSGVPPNDLKAMAERISRSPHLRVEGLMTVPPYVDDPEVARPFFRSLRQLRDALNEWLFFDYEVRGLSMGMSHDFEVAIEEGATHVRLGTAIFGPRPAGRER